jgi:hypothetical protein
MYSQKMDFRCLLDLKQFTQNNTRIILEMHVFWWGNNLLILIATELIDFHFLHFIWKNKIIINNTMKIFHERSNECDRICILFPLHKDNLLMCETRYRLLKYFYLQLIAILLIIKTKQILLIAHQKKENNNNNKNYEIWQNFGNFMPKVIFKN